MTLLRLAYVVPLVAVLSAQASLLYSTDGTLVPGFSTGGGYGGPSSPDVATRFIATTSGTVSAAIAPLSSRLQLNSSSITFELLTDAGGTPGVLLDTFFFTAPPITVPATALEVAASTTDAPVLNAGTPYWLEALMVATPPTSFPLWFEASPTLNGTVWSSTGGVNSDFLPAFAIQGVATPEPATWTLIPPAIMALGLIRSMGNRRGKKS